MKYEIAAAAAALSITSLPAVANDQAAAPAAAKMTVDMPIADLAADAKTRVVLDANFPGISTHAMYEQFKGMSLKQLQPMAADKISDAAIEKLAVDLAAIK